QGNQEAEDAPSSSLRRSSRTIRSSRLREEAIIKPRQKRQYNRRQLAVVKLPESSAEKPGTVPKGDRMVDDAEDERTEDEDEAERITKSVLARRRSSGGIRAGDQLNRELILDAMKRSQLEGNALETAVETEEDVESGFTDRYVFRISFHLLLFVT